MRLDLRVTYNDGTEVATAATTPDLIAFEEHFDRSVARLEAELRLTDICWLAWHSVTRQGKTAADFSTWVDSVENVALTDGEATPVPLGQTASTSE